MHLLGSSHNDLLTFDGKLGMTTYTNTHRFSLYRQFKTLTGVEPYLMLNLNRHIRYTVTRFRFGVSDIKVHRSRYLKFIMWMTKCRLWTMKSIWFYAVLHLMI